MEHGFLLCGATDIQRHDPDAPGDESWLWDEAEQEADQRNAELVAKTTTGTVPSYCLWRTEDFYQGASSPIPPLKRPILYRQNAICPDDFTGIAVEAVCGVNCPCCASGRQDRCWDPPEQRGGHLLSSHMVRTREP